MSFSPPIRRLSVSSTTRQEELINAYEAEEERIINLLSRKLEQLKEEKIGLENTLEAESESHVNRLTRELTVLRLAQHQQQHQQQQQQGAVSISPETRFSLNPAEPTFETMLEALRRENEQLRDRLISTERSYIRVSRLNDIYREELINHRRRMGLSVDDLIGHHSEALSQPNHYRNGSMSSASSPTSVIHQPGPTTNGVPIPRPASQLHRPIPIHHSTSSSYSSNTGTPLSGNSLSPSPFPAFSSPITSTSCNPASYVSTNTNITSPAGSEDEWTINHNAALLATQTLSYPSVPPPSLASSVGSPTTQLSHTHSPLEPASRRNSLARRTSTTRTVEIGNHRNPTGGSTHRMSVERGGRIAETGTLVPRSRAGSSSTSTSNTTSITTPNTIDPPSVNRVRGFRVGGFRIGFFDSEN